MLSVVKKWLNFKRPHRENLLGDAVRVMQAGLNVDFDFRGFSRRHIFNELSSKSEYGFYYYPYGYLFRHVRWGSVNEMGFRIKGNFPALKRETRDCYRIGLFGGSTAFDVLVPDEDAFFKILENKLNSDVDLRRVVGREFRVINLAQPGNLMLNQITNFVVFGHQLQLDLVISHNGVNDFGTAPLNDQNLVSNYSIAYCDVLEAWGRKIHDADAVDIDYLHADPSRADFKPASVRTPPDHVLRAFHYRLAQFEGLVLAAGGKFINGFQPWITSKSTLSNDETLKMQTYNPYYQRVYELVPELYAAWESTWLYREPIGRVVNIHRRFRELDGSVSHFGDVCHLLRPGNDIVASEYHTAIRNIFEV
jgi:hypothetical protein